MGGKEKEKTDCELRRVRHAIKATRAGRFLGVSVWVRLTSNPVHVRCHDCPGPWLPLQVEGGSLVAGAAGAQLPPLCVLENGGLINTKQTRRGALKRQCAHTAPRQSAEPDGDVFLGGVGSGVSGDSGGGAIKRRFYLQFLMTASSLASC